MNGAVWTSLDIGASPALSSDSETDDKLVIIIINIIIISETIMFSRSHKLIKRGRIKTCISFFIHFPFNKINSSGVLLRNTLVRARQVSGSTSGWK